MGEVYDAADDTLSRRVAIKVLPPSLLDQPERVRRFVQEARSASSLNHPHIVTIYEFGQSDVGGRTIPFIAMEFIEGTSLHQAIELNRGMPKKLVSLLTQVADGLAKAHSRGIIHRDLKPANIMVTPDGYAKIVDFGLAKLVQQDEGGPRQSTDPTVSITNAGGLVGTVGYVAPEQIQRRGEDPRSDIFSFGCILYEALTHRRAFIGDSDIDVLHATLHEQPPPVTSIDPAIPASLQRITERCLEKSPDDRYASMKDVAADLRDAERELAGGSGETDRTRPLPRLQFRRYARRLAIPVTIMVILAFGAYAVVRTLQPAAAPNLRSLVTWPTDEYDCNISPDQQWISFISTRGGAPAIYLRRVQGGEPMLLVRSPAKIDSHSWSPDSSRIAYLSISDGTPYLRTAAGFGGAASDSRRLPDSFRNGRMVRWLASGVYIENDGLWRLDEPSGRMTKLVAGADDRGRLSSFDVRSDGRKIAYALSHRRQSSVWTADIDGTNASSLTPADAEYRDYAPRFVGARGHQVVFSSDRTGQVDLWRITLLTGRAKQITFSPAAEWLEDVSTDGSFMAYLESTDRSQLWMVDNGKGELRQVTGDTDDGRWPSVAGGRVAFQRRKPAIEHAPAILDGEIVLGTFDGAGLLNPRVAASDAGLPMLSPDGKWLTFVKSAASGFELWAKDLATEHQWRITDHFKLPGLYMFPWAWFEANTAVNPVNHEVYVVTRSPRGEGIIAAGLTTGKTRQVVRESPTVAFRDIQVSPDGRLLGYVRKPVADPSASEVVIRELATGRETTAFTATHDWRRRVYFRGWTRNDDLLVLLANVNTDWSENVEALQISPGRAEVRTRVATSAFAGASALDRTNDELIVTTCDADGAHNVDAVSLATGAHRRLTSNRLPGISFAGLGIVAGNKILLSRQERNDDLWLIDFGR